jgi:hypothetical protein
MSNDADISHDKLNAIENTRHENSLVHTDVNKDTNEVRGIDWNHAKS